ncbi:hypothetical protein BD770DRAFT_407592 [Pilaira anomala]|nr:hypothetical protein BD770DRAFT_407592 [Pilaira anomala]
MAGTYDKIRREKYGYVEYYIDYIGSTQEFLKKDLGQLKQRKNKDHVVIDNFIQKVYLAFRKGNRNCNKDCLILGQVVIEFIRLLADSVTGDEKLIESVNSLHYIYVVPKSLFYFTQCDKSTVAKIISGHCINQCNAANNERKNPNSKDEAECVKSGFEKRLILSGGRYATLFIYNEQRRIFSILLCDPLPIPLIHSCLCCR